MKHVGYFQTLEERMCTSETGYVNRIEWTLWCGR